MSHVPHVSLIFHVNSNSRHGISRCFPLKWSAHASPSIHHKITSHKNERWYYTIIFFALSYTNWQHFWLHDPKWIRLEKKARRKSEKLWWFQTLNSNYLQYKTRKRAATFRQILHDPRVTSARGSVIKMHKRCLFYCKTSLWRNLKNYCWFFFIVQSPVWG